MMKALLLSVTQVLVRDMDFGERASTSAQVTVIGMVTIFAVLAILWGAISLLRCFMQNGSGKKETKEQVPVLQPQAVEETPVVQETSKEDNGALIAALTAAIAVVMEQENPGKGFRVVSFRRADKRNAWNVK